MRAFIPLVALAGIVLAADNYTVTASSVDAGTRANWCQSQTNTCIQLCGGTPDVTIDSCNSTTLDYNCTCKNGSAPGLQYYANSMTSLMCDKSYELCINANANDALAQQGCKDNILSTCGTLDASKVTGSSSSGSSSTTASSSAASATTQSTSTSKAGAVPTNIQHYGNAAGAVALGIFAYLL